MAKLNTRPPEGVREFFQQCTTRFLVSEQIWTRPKARFEAASSMHKGGQSFANQVLKNKKLEIAKPPVWLASCLEPNGSGRRILMMPT